METKIIVNVNREAHQASIKTFCEGLDKDSRRVFQITHSYISIEETYKGGAKFSFVTFIDHVKIAGLGD